MDVFLATEFHGGPFHEQEESNGNAFHDVHVAAGAGASASQSACDATLTTNMSMGSAERGTVGSGGSGCVVEGAERPWFSRRVLTAG